MANHKSAIKRALQSERNQIRNKIAKTKVKNITKKVRLAINDNTTDDPANVLNEAKSIIAKAASKGAIHKKTASRKISRLSKFVNTINS